MIIFNWLIKEKNKIDAMSLYIYALVYIPVHIILTYLTCFMNLTHILHTCLTYIPYSHIRLPYTIICYIPSSHIMLHLYIWHTYTNMQLWISEFSFTRIMLIQLHKPYLLICQVFKSLIWRAAFPVPPPFDFLASCALAFFFGQKILISIMIGWTQKIWPKSLKNWWLKIYI